MESESGSWWSRHGLTVTLLLTAFSLAFLVRTIFSLGVFQQWGWLYVYGGGSDSFYHWRVTDYILVNHQNLIHDPLLKFPSGAINPREPLFDWMNAILGTIFAPLFGGSAVSAAAFFLNLAPPLWSALTVFPIYLIGKEVSSKRMGLVAAMTYPFVVGSIQAGGLGYANYLAFYTFFILVYFYGYLRTVKLVSSRTYVTSFRHPLQALGGLREFLRGERKAVKWAVFTGVALGALALAWQGYPLAVAIVVIFLGVIMIVERIRRVDSFGLYVVTWIAGLVGFPMAVPYYLAQGLFATWFDLPLLLYFGMLLVLLPFVLLRQYPWVVTVPVLAALGALGLAALYVASPSSFLTLITGQGYFAKTLIYSTVAEAQAPSIDAIILSYGVLTFFLAFVGLVLFIVHLVRQRFRREHALFIVFAIVSIYLPISAAKFFYVGSPAFALLPAEAILIILDVAGYTALRRTVASLSGTRGQATAIRRAFKARHILVLLLVVVVLVPNVWYSVDAGIPYNSKSTYSSQVFGALPPALRTSSTNASTYYFGAAGTQLDTPSQYDEAGYNWLAAQDTNLAYSSRPAFISWWDYGFQAISQGQHPSVADNFQNGIVPAGNFLLAQNESLAIGVLTVTLLQAEERASGDTYLPPTLNQLLASDGVNLAELHTLMANTSADVPLVIAHPERYLPVNPANLDPINAMFDATSWFLATTLPASSVVQVYNDVQAYTGWTIRYAMVDSRLYPFSGTNTGIFYAPADLTARVIGTSGAPTSYYTIAAVGSDGNVYPVGNVPPTVSVVNYVLNQLPPFYHSMIYRIFMGYNGTDIGLTAGIPGLQGSLASYTPQPGWMLAHFEVAYRTGYYCPTPASQKNPACPIAANVREAPALAAPGNGTFDLSSTSYFSGGEAILQYYPGQPLSGTVILPDGTPVAGARLTVYDGWGTPHQTVVTTGDGSYAVTLPPGNVTVQVSAGPLQGLAQNGSKRLESIPFYVSPALGFSLAAPRMYQTIVLKPGTVNGFVFWNSTGNSTFDPQRDTVVGGANVTLGGHGLDTYSATTDIGGSFRLTDVAPGVYNFTVQTAGTHFSQGRVVVLPGQSASATAGLVPLKLSGTVSLEGGQLAAGATVTLSSGSSVRQTSSTPSGGYTFVNLVPGNYTLSAQRGINLASNASGLSMNETNKSVTRNLKLIPVVPIDFEVTAGGAAVPSFMVRMTPIRGTSGGAIGQIPQGSASLVFTTDSTGYIHSNVPAGNYSIYGYGPVGATFLAGFESAYLASTGARISVAPLQIFAAARLSGQSTLPGGVASSQLSATQLSLFDSTGNQLTFFANSSGAWSVMAPVGNYSLQAVAVGISGGAGNYSGVGFVDLTRTTTVSLPLTSAFHFITTVGALLPSRVTVYPAVAAAVYLTVNPAGGTVSTLTDRSGVAGFLLPTAQPQTTYCLATQATGFGTYRACGLSVGQLSALTRVVLPLFNDTLNVAVSGLPSGGTLHLNATALSAPAQSQTASGGAAISLSLAPGSYQITAWAPPPSGVGVYVPPQPVNLTLPLGSGTVNLGLQLYRQVTTHGTLNLPTGVAASSVHLRVYSPPFNLTVNGTVYESGFLLAPGVYSVYGSAVVVGVNYSALTHISVNATGVATPTVSISGGTALSARLVGADQQLINLTAPVYWTGPDGSQLYSVAVGGVVSLNLPGASTNLTYVPSLHVTVPTTANGVLRYATYDVVVGTACSVGVSASRCTVPLTVSYQAAALAGQFFWNGAPLTLSGTVRLMGPYPSLAVTIVSTTSGSFTAAVVPGIYTLYATGGSGSGFVAALSKITVPFPSANITVPLAPAWSDVLTLNPPSGIPTAATGNVTWTDVRGLSWTAPGSPVGSPQTWVLPQGVWKVSANATASPYGRAAVTLANSTVSLLSGNQATNLALTPQFSPAVTLATLVPDSATVPDGGSATFAFTVQNTGDEPVTFRFFGDPAGWNFTFTPATMTLGVGPGNSTGGGTVRIQVPYGTATNHAPVVLGAVLLSNPSRTIGTALPAPTVSIVPVPAIAVAPQSGQGTAVAPSSASVHFVVVNTGNTPYTAQVSVLNTVQLVQLGWTVQLREGAVAAPPTFSISPSESIAFTVVLSTSAYAQPPGSVIVQARDLNSSGNIVASTDLPVSIASVAAPGGLTLGGPNVGAPPAIPDWGWTLLALIPAGAFLGVVLAFRWSRTRRWLRR
ncbi:MAG: carboxypeptidase regulatory-like domain-containing protein [Thermoplasmata archaeon]|nr:carboxypeptidase regulatory-like domain-containing protein [Thermoplasmata archaeon]